MIKNCVIGLLLILLALSVSANAVLAQGMPRPFLNETELKTYLSDYPIRRGNDCDDAALRLFWDAWNDGYLVWPCPVYNGWVMGEKVVPLWISGKRHFGSWAWAGNYIYYIDLAMVPPHYVRLQKSWLD